MKKFLSLVMIAALLTSCGILLTSCKHEHTFSSEWSWDNEAHWHACEKKKCTEVSDKAEHTLGEGSYTCTVCGWEMPENLRKTTKVTAEEWQNALNLQGKNVKAVTAQSYGITNTYVTKASDGKVYYQKYEGLDIVKEIYYSIENGKYYCYMKEDEGWDKFEIVKELLDQTFDLNKVYAYESFTYDEESKCYKASKITDETSGTTPTIMENVSVRFENGRLVSIEYTQPLSELIPTTVIVSVTYGDVSLTLPEAVVR